jgi:hypothetical protein
MARIRCHYADCVFLDDGYCSAAAIELDPDTGCATYTPTETAKEDWKDEEDSDEWEDDDAEEEEEDAWDEEEDEF